MTNIIQNTPEWLQAKKSKIGGSEIYSLIYHYCKPELEILGVDLIKEKPFKSALELFIKIKHGEEINDISEVNSQFGKGMEPYIAYRLSNEVCPSKRTDNFIINEGLHNLAACSPDGYAILPEYPEIEEKEPLTLQDFDKTCKIDYHWGDGANEEKTTPYSFNFEAERGPKWSYILQHQYQMLVCGLKWGILAIISPKEDQFDTDFFKGKIVKAVEGYFYEVTKGSTKELELSEELANYYNFYHYIYPVIPNLQKLILKALNAFQTDLDNNKYPNPSFGDKVSLEREKKLLGKLWPDRFGEIEADEEINNYINQRMIAHTEALKAETEKVEFDNKIILATRKYTKIIGTDYKATYDSRGSIRYSKISVSKGIIKLL